MLKISKAISAGKAQTYFKAEFSAADQRNYYTEGKQEPDLIGTWHGRLAEQYFGLSGAVDALHYQRLSEGQDPWDGTQLIKHRAPAVKETADDDKSWSEFLWRMFEESERARMPEWARQAQEEWESEQPGWLEKKRAELQAKVAAQEKAKEEKKKYREHIAAWDLTIGAPKSYSVTALVGGDRGLIDDHQAAVRKALDAAEQYTQARLPDRAPETTGEWAAALFLHDSARPVEGEAPNPHLHTHAVVFNMTKAADKLRSLQPQELFRVQSFVSAVYQSELSYRARQRGYQLEHGKNYATEIRGYTPEYLRAMSARTEEIEKEREAKGLTGAEADERINKRLRQAKQTWEPEKLHAEHRAQAEKFRNDPGAVVAQARGRHAHQVTEPQRRELAQDAITFAKERLFESSAVVDHYELMRDALRYGLGHLRLPDVEHALEIRLAQAEREFIPVGHIRTHAPGERFTTVEMRSLEADTIRRALAGQGKTEPIAAKLTRDEFRESYKHRQVDGREIALSDHQMWMAWNVLTSPDQFVIVRGAAGAGKSTAMEPIGEVAEEHRSAGYEVRGLAATGVAALNLGEVGIRSETLQAHLVRGVKPTAARRLYIVDEGSLVGTRQFNRFMGTVRPEDRVIVAYDPRQHQSVEAGRIVEELEQAGVRAFRLEKIVRQRNAPELLEAIECFAKGQTREGLVMLEQQGRILEYENRRDRFRAMAEELAEHPKVTHIVSPDNRSIGEINLRVRNELQSRELLGADLYEAWVLVGRRDVKVEDRKCAARYHEGDLVRFGKAVRFLEVRSGDYGRVVGVDAERNLVRLQLPREIAYNPREAYGVDLYTAEKRSLAIGERIQVTRAWKQGKVANRESGTVVSLDPAGNLGVQLDRGRLVNWNAAKMPHFEYAYARTSYSEQSTTAERVLLHLDSGDTTIRNLIDKRGVYVGASRAEMDLRVFTDSKEGLLGAHSPVNRITQKSAALNREEIAGFSVAVA